MAGCRVLVRPDGPLDETVPAKRAVTSRDLLTFTVGLGTALEMFEGPRPWPIVAAAEDLAVVVLTQRLFDGPALPQWHTPSRKPPTTTG